MHGETLKDLRICLYSFFLMFRFLSFFAYRPRESVYADYVSIKVIL